MIPKTIHYCWFGRNPKPKLAEKCIKSWRKKCPDYQIVEWNEDNFDISAAPLYVRQAYETKKWAFVTDFVRLKVVYDHGGIYLDTDVEIKQSLDILLGNRAYFGFQDDTYVATGLGFGAEKGHPILIDLMSDYYSIPFVLENGIIDNTPCPTRNTDCFVRHGLQKNGEKQVLDDGILILPKEYLSPIDFWSGKKHITKYTISIHWFAASWHSADERKRLNDRRAREKKKILDNNIDFLIHLPNRFLRDIIGNERYDVVKRIIRK